MIASKVVSEIEVDNFMRELRNAEQDLKNREIEEEKCIVNFEQNMNLLGITAVEDLLQKDVRNCINHLREAGLKGNFIL